MPPCCCWATKRTWPAIPRTQYGKPMISVGNPKFSTCNLPMGQQIEMNLS